MIVKFVQLKVIAGEFTSERFSMAVTSIVETAGCGTYVILVKLISGSRNEVNSPPIKKKRLLPKKVSFLKKKMVGP